MQIDADPDPDSAYNFDAEPGPTYQVAANPDPTVPFILIKMRIHADPDLDPQHCPQDIFYLAML